MTSPGTIFDKAAGLGYYAWGSRAPTPWPMRASAREWIASATMGRWAGWSELSSASPQGLWPRRSRSLAMSYAPATDPLALAEAGTAGVSRSVPGRRLTRWSGAPRRWALAGRRACPSQGVRRHRAGDESRWPQRDRLAGQPGNCSIARASSWLAWRHLHCPGLEPDAPPSRIAAVARGASTPVRPERSSPPIWSMQGAAFYLTIEHAGPIPHEFARRSAIASRLRRLPGVCLEPVRQ
jgi:epoxyqueuosine reductase